MTTTSQDHPLASALLGLLVGAALLLVPSDARAGCQTNADCRAGRQCRAGECVYVSCEKDLDCPGKQVCEAGRCMPPAAGPAPTAASPPPPPPPTAATVPPPVTGAPPVQPAPPPAATAPSPGPPVSFGPGPQASGRDMSTTGNAPTSGRPGPIVGPGPGAGPAPSAVTPTTEPYSPPLAIAGAIGAAVGAIMTVIGIPLAATSTETLRACFGSDCRDVEVTDTAQRDAGAGLAIPGLVLLLGGGIMLLVGDMQVAVEPGSGPEAARASLTPEVTLLPTGSAARWRF